MFSPVFLGENYFELELDDDGEQRNFLNRKKTEMTMHNCRAILIHHNVIWRFKKYIAEPIIERTQKTARVAHIRFEVTTCLYRSPNNRARRLSTLTAVNVNKDTEHRRNPVK